MKLFSSIGTPVREEKKIVFNCVSTAYKFNPKVKIYTNLTLPELLKEVALEDENPIYGQQVKVVRFVVNLAGQILFGREGTPGGVVPAHKDLVEGEAVLAAGNMFFNANNELIGVNNKSSNYCPNIESAFLATKIMCDMDAAFSPHFVMEELNRLNATFSTYTTFTVDGIQSKLEEMDFSSHFARAQELAVTPGHKKQRIETEADSSVVEPEAKPVKAGRLPRRLFTDSEESTPSSSASTSVTPALLPPVQAPVVASGGESLLETFAKAYRPR